MVSLKQNYIFILKYFNYFVISNNFLLFLTFLFSKIKIVPAHFQTKSKQISVAKGKQVHIQCNVQGDNPIDIQWKLQSTQQTIDESMDTRLV